MIEEGSAIRTKNTAGTLIFRNQADDADLTLGNAPAAHTHELAAGATDVTATASEINKLAGTPAGLTATEIGYLDGVTSAIQTQISAIGIRTQTDQTANRTLDTVYQNTGTAPMFVQVYMSNTNSSAWCLKTDGSNPPVSPISGFTITSSGFHITLSGWVMPGNYYKVSKLSGSGNGSIIQWTEWS